MQSRRLTLRQRRGPFQFRGALKANREREGISRGKHGGHESHEEEGERDGVETGEQGPDSGG